MPGFATKATKHCAFNRAYSEDEMISVPKMRKTVCQEVGSVIIKKPCFTPGALRV